MAIFHTEVKIDLADISGVIRNAECETVLYVLSILKEKMGSTDFRYEQLCREVCNRYDLNSNFLR